MSLGPEIREVLGLLEWSREAARAAEGAVRAGAGAGRAEAGQCLCCAALPSPSTSLCIGTAPKIRVPQAPEPSSTAVPSEPCRGLSSCCLRWCPEASPESNSRTDFLPKSSHSWAVPQHLGSSPDPEQIFLLVCCRSLLVLSFPLSSCVIICMFTIFCRSYLWVGTKPRDLQGRDSPACHQTSEAAP